MNGESYLYCVLVSICANLKLQRTLWLHGLENTAADTGPCLFAPQFLPKSKGALGKTLRKWWLTEGKKAKEKATNQSKRRVGQQQVYVCPALCDATGFGRNGGVLEEAGPVNGGKQIKNSSFINISDPDIGGRGLALS